MINQALMTIKLTHYATVLIPGAQTLQVFTASSTKGLRTAAHQVVQYQNLLIHLERIYTTTIYQCGLPIESRSFKLVRKPTTSSKIAKSPAPLQFSNPNKKNTMIHVRSWDLKYESFGYCRSTRKGPDSLLGGSFAVSFQEERNHQVKPPLKPLYF